MKENMPSTAMRASEQRVGLWRMGKKYRSNAIWELIGLQIYAIVVIKRIKIISRGNYGSKNEISISFHS